MARTLEQLKGQYRSARTMNQRRGGPRGRMMHGKKEKPKYSKGTIKRLLGYIAPYKFRLMAAILCMFCTTGTSLVGSYMLRPMINALVEDNGKTGAERLATLAGMLILLISVYLVGVVSTYLQSRIMLGVSQGAIEKIRRKPIDPKIENMIFLAGFILLFGFMIVVALNDVLRFF